jgi:hypothetical protein
MTSYRYVEDTGWRFHGPLAMSALAIRYHVGQLADDVPEIVPLEEVQGAEFGSSSLAHLQDLIHKICYEACPLVVLRPPAGWWTVYNGAEKVRSFSNRRDAASCAFDQVKSEPRLIAYLDEDSMTNRHENLQAALVRMRSEADG